MGKYRIADNGDTRRYFIQVPNLVDDTRMSTYAFRLYVHFKRVAGDDGKCWQSTRTLSEACGISLGKITESKRELVKMGLITICEKKTERGGKPYHEIEITDIWEQNFKEQASSPDEQPSSGDERASSPDEQPSSPGEIKNNPIKNTIQRKTHEEDNAGKPAKQKPLPLTEGQRLFLDAFDAKRFKTKIQRDVVLEMEEKYGISVLQEGINWAAKLGMSVSRAVVSLEAALPKWGKPKPSPKQKKSVAEILEDR